MRGMQKQKIISITGETARDRQRRLPMQTDNSNINTDTDRQYNACVILIKKRPVV